MQHFSRLDMAALTSLRSSFTALLQSCTHAKQRCNLSDFSVAVTRLTVSELRQTLLRCGVYVTYLRQELCGDT